MLIYNSAQNISLLYFQLHSPKTFLFRIFSIHPSCGCFWSPCTKRAIFRPKRFYTTLLPFYEFESNILVFPHSLSTLLIIQEATLQWKEEWMFPKKCANWQEAKLGWSDEIQRSRIHQCEFGKKEGSGDLFSPPHVRHTRQPSSVSFSQTATFFSFAKPHSIQIMNETTFMGEGGIFSETIW